MSHPAATDVFANLFARSGRDARRLKVAATDELARRHSYAQARAIAADDGLPYSPRWHRLYLASQPVLGYQTGAK